MQQYRLVKVLILLFYIKILNKSTAQAWESEKQKKKNVGNYLKISKDLLRRKNITFKKFIFFL